MSFNQPNQLPRPPMKLRYFVSLLALFTLGGLAGCSPGANTPTPVAAVTPSPVPFASSTPVATATPPAMTPTPAAVATSTPVPSATPVAPPPSPATPTAPPPVAPTTAPAPAANPAAAGQAIFMANCTGCHPNGDQGVGPSLKRSSKDAEGIRTQVRQGKDLMPAFSASQISDAQLNDVVSFVLSLRQ